MEGCQSTLFGREMTAWEGCGRPCDRPCEAAGCGVLGSVVAGTCSHLAIVRAHGGVEGGCGFRG